MGLVADSQLHKSNIKWPFSLLNPCHSHRRVMVVQTRLPKKVNLLLTYYIVSEIVNLVLLVFSHALSTSHKKEQ